MGALRSAFLRKAGLRTGVREGGRVHVPCGTVKVAGSHAERKGAGEYSTCWGQPVDYRPPRVGAGLNSQPTKGEVHRWKAPRVQRIAILFAEVRGKRPCTPVRAHASDLPTRDGLASPSRLRPGASSRRRSSRQARCGTRRDGSAQAGRLRWSAQAGLRGELVAATSNEDAAAMSASPAGVAASSRHEVSEPIGSGRSSRTRAIASGGAVQAKARMAPGP